MLSDISSIDLSLAEKKKSMENLRKKISFSSKDALHPIDPTISYVELGSATEEQHIHLPILKWSTFKKGYTIGFWLFLPPNEGSSAGKSNKTWTLYQFRQSKYGGIGICATLTQTSLPNTFQVTIYTLPFSHKRGQYMRSKILYIPNSWQFWSISHDNPYLHRPNYAKYKWCSSIFCGTSFSSLSTFE